MTAKASKGFIRIPESQILLERRQKFSNKTWHQNIMNLLLGKNVCGSCLRLEDGLVDWDAEFVLGHPEYDVENSLKNIMMTTFGPSVVNIIPTKNFCQKCVDIILSAHMLILELRKNCNHIQRKLTEISQQMKWTNYLDETGSLTESINNKVNFEEYTSKTTSNNLPPAKTQSEVTGIDHTKDFIGVLEKDMKTHKIILNDESLKTKLLQEPEMQKFLFLKDDNAPRKSIEHKLPAGITVRKVRKSINMSDFAPQDLLELNWAEDENDSVNTDTQVLNNTLHSNEALIMNLMEEARTVEKHIHFHENLKLQANKHVRIPVAEQNFNNSLSVKLLQTNKPNENYSDNDELIPQDLLELKWPEEQPNNQPTHQTKIPVKKLNFNEALTVKFIPSHKPGKDQESANEMAPHELLELNWKEAETQNVGQPSDKNDKQHIDLTQWLQDQGMSTIKTITFNENKKIQNLNDAESHTSKRIRSEINDHAISDTIKETQLSDTNTVKDLITSNIILKNSETVKELDNNAIRCGLCDLSFIQFASYCNHYKTHIITEAAKCYRCPAQFSVIELLVEHLLIIHSEDMAYCTLCYALLNQDKLAKHMVDYHAKKVQVINAPKSAETHCEKCNQIVINSPNHFKPHVCVFKLECTECKQDCVHKKYLTSYIEQIKANINEFKCTDCDFQYKTKQDIIRHANYAHLNLKPKLHQCNICNAIFSLQVDLANHSESYHFRCRGCRNVFADKITLDSHDCTKSVVKDLVCECCGEVFMALKCYLQHKETALIVSAKCGFCHGLVPNKCNMSRHMQNVHNVCLKTGHNIILYECTICQTDFKSECEFKEHACLYDCHICLKRFTVKTLYEKHLLSHVEGVTSLKCIVCCEQLIDKHALAHHMLTHSDYSLCPVCADYIETKSLKQHVESHRNPLKCPHCTLVCENQNQYEVHVNRFHLLNRPYQCDLCKKSFYSKHKLREHIRQHSSHARREKCILCGKRFANKLTLDKHMKLHSVGQLFDCDLCKKRYISPALLNEHRKTHSKHSTVQVPETSQN